MNVDGLTNTHAVGDYLTLQIYDIRSLAQCDALRLEDVASGIPVRACVVGNQQDTCDESNVCCPIWGGP